MTRVPLFEEYRLIERCEQEINGAWKGAHLLLFFLAFVFGSFCTFCFHMLMYLFDEKCVLFPKLLSLTTLKHNVIYEFIPSTKDIGDLPVDFLSTQWVEKSTCSLPTYVPLVSGIFGLVWTTMFLMCSTGSRTLTGLQRPWRVLPPVFLFSLAMGSLCVYSSTVTHYGLQELCLKLGEITGSPTCTYTVNVATLTYERRIRGVYQATRLTILSAWLHTACWLLSALLALVRVLMAVDFQLVRVSVHLHGDIDRILEKHEVQIRTVMPETWTNDEKEYDSATRIHYKRRDARGADDGADAPSALPTKESDLLFMASNIMHNSDISLVPEEGNRIARIEARKHIPKDRAFIITWLYDLIQQLPLPDASHFELEERSSGASSLADDSRSGVITKILAQAELKSESEESTSEAGTDDLEVKKVLSRVDSLILTEYQQAKKRSGQLQFKEDTSPRPSTSKPPDGSLMNLTPELQAILEKNKSKAIQKKKSNLKTIGVQTDRRKLRVQISEKNMKSESAEQTSSTEDKQDVDKETQTKEKEKQD